jgi:hypothetical protein
MTTFLDVGEGGRPLREVEWAALTVAGRQASKQEDFRSKLEIGSHPVDFKIRLVGQIQVEAPTFVEKKEKIDLKELLAAVLDRIPGGKAKDIVTQLVDDFHDRGTFRSSLASRQLVDWLVEETTVFGGKERREGALSGLLTLEVEEPVPHGSGKKRRC